MPHRRRSIYKTVYAGLFTVFFLFFFHHMFTNVYLDVLHINGEYEFTFFGMQYTHRVRDWFPAFNADSPAHQMDIQIYFSRLGSKLREFCLALILLRVLQVLNMFLKEVPGREWRKGIALVWAVVALYTYEVLDFIVHAGQTDWRPQAVIFAIVVVFILLTVKDSKNAK